MPPLHHDTRHAIGDDDDDDAGNGGEMRESEQRQPDDNESSMAEVCQTDFLCGNYHVCDDSVSARRCSGAASRAQTASRNHVREVQGDSEASLGDD